MEPTRPCTIGRRQYNHFRSEKRRVGEEGKSWWSPDHLKKKKLQINDERPSRRPADRVNTACRVPPTQAARATICDPARTWAGGECTQQDRPAQSRGASVRT